MKTRTPKRIGISLGNIEEFVGGLGEFACQVGQAMADRADSLRAEHGLALYVHCRPALTGCFGPAVQYLPVQRSQEWRHTAPVQLDLWHRLNQLNRYGPPGSTGLRLVTVHDLNYRYEKQGLSRLRHQWRMRQLLAKTDAVITITQHVAADVRSELNWRGPLQVIHNGAADLSGAPQEAVAELQGRAFFFHISRMTASKNVESLLRTMQIWPERQLVLAGPSTETNVRLRALAAQMNLQNVSVLTAVSNAQKAWLYAHCTAFFFPSITEGFGLPPIEAMYFGKPTFLSDRTSLPEVGGDAAFYWHDFAPESMRRVVEQGLAVHDEARARRVRLHAGRFSWPNSAQQYLQAYLALLGAGVAERAE